MFYSRAKNSNTVKLQYLLKYVKEKHKIATYAMKNNKKTTAKRKTTRKTKKPKVYIPAYKIIILCALIIVVCVFLLFITTISEPGGKKEKNPQLTQRYEKTETKPEVKKEVTPPKKTTPPPESKKTQKKKDDAQKTDERAQPAPKVKSTEPAKTKPQAESVPTPKIEPVTTTAAKKQEPAPQPKVQKTEPEVKKAPVEQKNAATKDTYNFPAARNHAELVFIFDDGGHNISQAQKFLTLPFPITIAVLPKLAHSADVAAATRKSGNEVMLHQPMQAVNKSVNPGPGAITPEMDDNQIISLLFQNINEVGPIAGINNHEGSAITADAEKMSTIMRVTQEQGIFFLDSRTNVDTQVPFVAREMGYSYYERNIFLDNEKTKDNILKELRKGLDIANKNGTVIMIGHVWSADILPAVLKEVYPELVNKGYTFKTVSNSHGAKR